MKYSHIEAVLFDVGGVRKAVALLQDLGGKVKYNLFQGGHELEPWKEELPIALEWLLSNASQNDEPGPIYLRLISTLFFFLN